jgi:hypothetical protein
MGYLSQSDHRVLFMARKAVCQSGDLIFGLLQVTIQAPAHVHLDRWPGNCHATHISMTSLTINAGLQMGLMAEIDKIGLLIYTDPGDRLATLPVTAQCLNCLVVGCNDGMTAHTFLHGRNTSYIGVQCTGMTEQTLHTSFNMSTVAVGNGLLRRCQDLGAREKYTAEDNDYN